MKYFLTILILASICVFGTEITFKWTAETNVDGYKIYYGTNSGVYTRSNSVGVTNTLSITNLDKNKTYYFRLVSHKDQIESPPTYEIAYDFSKKLYIITPSTFKLTNQNKIAFLVESNQFDLFGFLTNVIWLTNP